MSVRAEASAMLRQNVIKQQCVVLHLPTVASQCAPLAEQAERERQPYLGYLEALFAAELEDRERRANELVEAKQQLQLRRVLAHWARYDVIAIDEVGYVPLAELGAEFLFQVIADRAEQAVVLLTTNLPFSEWTQVIPNTRLCKALLDRITDRAHIIETGSDSYRFRRTLELRGRHSRSTTTNGAIPNPPPSTEKGSPPGT